MLTVCVCVCSADMHCSQPLLSHQASIHPSQFLLRAGEQRHLTAVVPGSAHTQDVGAVLVLSGDETLRQQLRRRPPGAPVSPLAPANLRSEDFQVRCAAGKSQIISQGSAAFRQELYSYTIILAF